MIPSQTLMAVQATAIIFDSFSHSQIDGLARSDGLPRNGTVLAIGMLSSLGGPVPSGSTSIVTIAVRAPLGPKVLASRPKGPHSYDTRLHRPWQWWR